MLIATPSSTKAEIPPLYFPYVHAQKRTDSNHDSRGHIGSSLLRTIDNNAIPRFRHAESRS